MGAYTATHSIDVVDGMINFSTSDDPNLEESFHAFVESATAARKIAKSITQKEIEAEVLSYLGLVNMPVSNYDKGLMAMDRWLSRKSASMITDERHEILNTTVADFEHYADLLDRTFRNGKWIAVSEGPAFGRRTITIKPLVSQPAMTVYSRREVLDDIISSESSLQNEDSTSHTPQAYASAGSGGEELRPSHN